MLFADAKLVWEAHVKGQRNTGERLARPTRITTQMLRVNRIQRKKQQQPGKKRFIV